MAHRLDRVLKHDTACAASVSALFPVLTLRLPFPVLNDKQAAQWLPADATLSTLVAALLPHRPGHHFLPAPVLLKR
ncbi:Uncharacterised protein [Vibrio cholerae]|nr:Uncharacterised protein [Vibrio cholerae]CSD03172.1 Uncharacterised protein [Vibrio cholerae]